MIIVKIKETIYIKLFCKLIVTIFMWPGNLGLREEKVGVSQDRIPEQHPKPPCWSLPGDNQAPPPYPTPEFNPAYWVQQGKKCQRKCPKFCINQHAFHQQKLLEPLPHARDCSRHWGFSRGQKSSSTLVQGRWTINKSTFYFFKSWVVISGLKTNQAEDTEHGRRQGNF